MAPTTRNGLPVTFRCPDCDDVVVLRWLVLDDEGPYLVCPRGHRVELAADAERRSPSESRSPTVEEVILTGERVLHDSRKVIAEIDDLLARRRTSG